MTYSFEDRIEDRPRLPVAGSHFVPPARRGLVGRLLSAIGTWSANRRLDRARRRYRSGIAPEVPDHLREDIGLPPAPARIVRMSSFEYRWK